jgi:hypothetical protein
MAGDIFYSQVDKNLKEELKARGISGHRRNQKDLQYMLEKIANIEIGTYTHTRGTNGFDGTNSLQKDSIIGGKQTRGPKFMPSGEHGFLNENKPDIELIKGIEIDPKIEGKIVSSVKITEDKVKIKDTSLRIPPIITSCQVSIADNSRGLLNKAVIQIQIPDPIRDLDWVEQYWFRPGKYAYVLIQHPDSAVITEKSLDPETVLDDATRQTEKFKKNYPDIGDLEYQITTMNSVRFEGLITSFDFSYQTDGSVEATIYITGTSNVYTDLSMFLETEPQKKKDGTEPIDPQSFNLGHTVYTLPDGRKTHYAADSEDVTAVVNTFYEELLHQVNSEIVQNQNESQQDQRLIQSEYYSEYPGGDENWILTGQPFSQDYTNNATIKTNASDEGYGFELHESQTYITLNYLINYINDRVLRKLPGSKITCDSSSLSNYYNNLVSADPYEILLLGNGLTTSTQEYGRSETADIKDTIITKVKKEVDGKIVEEDEEIDIVILKTPSLIWYENVYTNTHIQPNSSYEEFPGFHNNGKAYANRIFINLNVIKDIVLRLDKIEIIPETINKIKPNKGVQIKEFISSIGAVITMNTAGAIKMNLITDPKDPLGLELKYYDSNYIGQEDVQKDVEPFSVPMFANHSNGTIVRDFKLSAKLPGRAKQLAYVLNEGTDISQSDIAPFLSYMYSNKDKEENVKKLFQTYLNTHHKYLTLLTDAKEDYSHNPTSYKKKNSLRLALQKYLQYPTEEIDKSNLLNTPIFPYDASITIDGVNGFRYGDVLQFNALPYRYRTQTVFSIINISHTVGSSGLWTTELTCIMRPKV